MLYSSLDSKGKFGYPGRVPRDIYQHIPPIYELDNGCTRQYGVIFGEQLLGYTPKGTQNVPLIEGISKKNISKGPFSLRKEAPR